ncbi:MAG: ATP-binding protein [Candidatus Eisenbacteria bacterium]
MKTLLPVLPLLLFAGVLLLFFLPWGLTRFTRAFRGKEDRPNETEFLLTTVQDVVTGIRASESDLRDLYSKAERRASFLGHYHQGILESLMTGVVACNRRGEITSLNRAAAAILRVPASSARGMRLDGLVGPGHIFARMLSAVVKGEPVEDRVELELRREGEEPLWIELRTSILYGRSGHPVGATFLLDDVTERRILRRRVALKERLAAMGEVSAGIAHEFRNALNSLGGLAKLIARRSEGDERIAPLAGEILNETKRMEQTLHELRLFVKPEELSAELVSPGELIRSVLVPLVENAAARGIRFQMAVPRDLPEIRADRTLLAQALRNLVQNAIHAMESGGTLTVRARARGPAGEKNAFLMISVSDTGSGIPEEVREKIFTPFFTTRPEGTGLGLPLVQKAMAAHGGSVDLESSPSRGATFTLTLPLGCAERACRPERERAGGRSGAEDAGAAGPSPERGAGAR